MNYYSTNKKSPVVGFREAVLNGQPPDKGLYFPESIPLTNPGIVQNIRSQSKESLALEMLMPYVGDDIPVKEMEWIIAETISFDFPLVEISDRMYVLELFHGPTLAFKDVGARFLSRCIGYFNRLSGKKTIVLVATSGDTGGAVANAFADVEGVHVVILYPAGKVSYVQEMQLVTCGDRVSALQVSGDFDDCQRMVKMAFADEKLKHLTLTSANSINVARWLPQQYYYVDALRQWPEVDLPVFSVPCGNLGNISAGLLAMKSLQLFPHFIAACNENNAIHQYILNGAFLPADTIPTISNAMDVGEPSNFPRILELFNHGIQEIRSVMSSDSITDEETREQIRKTFSRSGYIPDPHGAVAMKALEKYLDVHTTVKGIFLETAHPVKFPDVVEPLINQHVAAPAGFDTLNRKEKRFFEIGTAYPELQTFLQKM